MKSGTDNIIPVNNHRQLINLAFNKNALVPLFALRSAIGLVMMSHSAGPVAFVELLSEVALICEWMQFEPCEDLRALIAVAVGRNALSHLEHGVLCLEGDEEDSFTEAHIRLEVSFAWKFLVAVSGGSDGTYSRLFSYPLPHL
ncbi:hypothetical protein OESDEN_17466 [Oesophagostomum dentatum]|uniref:Uncharacterized protein n=1 Tax=Oesophagostomum dentatum TaxID=61180 RepID=A0A0B1SD25_OESDE|nr:hypothetical protein OESDEN_17466 [Oesophagostomum dentatum]